MLDKFAPPAIRARLSPPSFNLRPVIRSKYAWHAGGVYLLFGIAFLLYFTFFQKRLTTDLGYSSQTAGYLFMLLGVAGLAGGMYWGSFSDRFGRERTLALNLFLAGVGGFLFGARTGLPGLIISAILFGSTGLSFPGLMGAACADRFGPKLASAVAGAHHHPGGGGAGHRAAHRRGHERRPGLPGRLVSLLGRGVLRGRCRRAAAARAGRTTGTTLPPTCPNCRAAAG